MNKVFLIGRLGRDPEQRATTAGTPVSCFTIATDRYRSGENGYEKVTDWHRIVAYGKTAEHSERFLRKGRLVCVEGSLQTRAWEKTPGEKHYITEVIATRLVFLEFDKGADGVAYDSGSGETEEAFPGRLRSSSGTTGDR